MKQQSDLLLRQPSFDQLQNLAAEAARQGAYDGLPFDMTAYIDGMQPVGLADSGLVVHPDNYVPEVGSPVLLYDQPDFGGKINFPHIDGSELASLKRIVRLAGSKTVVVDVVEQPETIDPDQIGWIIGDEVWLEPVADRLPNRPVALPRILAMNLLFSSARDTWIAALGHETYHWDDHLHRMPALQGTSQALENISSVVALTEKHAFAVCGTIFRNLGLIAVSPTIDEAAEPYERYVPSQSRGIYEDIKRRQRQVTPDYSNDDFCYAQTVEIATHLFGRSGEPITLSEEYALATLGCL